MFKREKVTEVFVVGVALKGEILSSEKYFGTGETEEVVEAVTGGPLGKEEKDDVVREDKVAGVDKIGSLVLLVEKEDEAEVAGSPFAKVSEVSIRFSTVEKAEEEEEVREDEEVAEVALAIVSEVSIWSSTENLMDDILSLVKRD